MIKDIELQFVERIVPTPEVGVGIGKTVRILQSRKLVEKAERGYGYGGFQYHEWTAWEDVPLVTQPGGEHG